MAHREIRFPSPHPSPRWGEGADRVCRSGFALTPTTRPRALAKDGAKLDCAPRCRYFLPSHLAGTSAADDIGRGRRRRNPMTWARIAVPLCLALALGAAARVVLPRAFEAGSLLAAADDP